MFKLKFKRCKSRPQFSEEYPGFIDPDDADGSNHYPGEFYQDASHLQGCECLFCNNPISGAHLVVTTRQNEYFLHPGCILSSFALILNGFGFIAKLLFNRKNRG